MYESRKTFAFHVECYAGSNRAIYFNYFVITCLTLGEILLSLHLLQHQELLTKLLQVTLWLITKNIPKWQRAIKQEFLQRAKCQKTILEVKKHVFYHIYNKKCWKLQVQNNRIVSERGSGTNDLLNAMTDKANKCVQFVSN